MIMRAKPFTIAGLALMAAMFTSGASAELKKVAYPPVKVEVAEAYQPDAAFDKMRKAFIEATRNKDANALFALVAPAFVWNVDGVLSTDYDFGRDPLHNFKVLFAFRDFGKDTDSGVDGGPLWDLLSAFAAEDTYYKLDQGAGLVCGPMAATVQGEDALAQARKKIDTAEDAAEWYFVVRETRVSKAPDDKGLPIASVTGQALPVLSSIPAARDNEPAPAPTHYEVLLPTGKSGWIPAASARPLEASRLCYTPTAKGGWAIGLYDGLPQDEED
jgi:hypothetical protein